MLFKVFETLKFMTLKFEYLVQRIFVFFFFAKIKKNNLTEQTFSNQQTYTGKIPLFNCCCCCELSIFPNSSASLTISNYDYVLLVLDLNPHSTVVGLASKHHRLSTFRNEQKKTLKQFIGICLTRTFFRIEMCPAVFLLRIFGCNSALNFAAPILF